jgi:hypothetical protein
MGSRGSTFAGSFGSTGLSDLAAGGAVNHHRSAQASCVTFEMSRHGTNNRRGGQNDHEKQRNHRDTPGLNGRGNHWLASPGVCRSDLAP